MSRITIHHIINANDIYMILETEISRGKIKEDFFNYLVDNKIVTSMEKLLKAEDFDENLFYEEGRLIYSSSNDSYTILFATMLQMYCIAKGIKVLFEA